MTEVIKPIGHDKPKCGGAKRDGSGGNCTRPAGWGTPTPGIGRCKLHGGSSPTHQIAAQKELVRQAAAAYGLPVDIPADIALLQELARTAGHVAALGEMVAQIPADQLGWGVVEETDGVGESGGVQTKRKAAPHITVQMYRDERRHLLDVCKTVEGLKIADRHIALSERQEALAREFVGAVLDDLGLTVEQRERLPEVWAATHARLMGVAQRRQVEGEVVR